MKAVTDIKRHEIIPQEGRIPLHFYNSVSPVVGSPPASGLGCEPNPFYLFLWVLTTNALHIAICLSLQMFKLHILAQLGPPCLCSSSKFPVWVPLFCHYLSCLVSSFLFFHTFSCFLVTIYNLCRFHSSISHVPYVPLSRVHFLAYWLQHFLNLQPSHTLSLRFLVPVCSFPQQLSFAIRCYVSDVMCQMLWCFFHFFPHFYITWASTKKYLKTLGK